MCGLYGYSTNKEKSLSEEQKDTKEKIVKSLAVAMEERGTDSSGMAFVKDNTFSIAKSAINSTKFLEKKVVKEMLANRPELILGHARMATSGIINKENAHPFIKGSIIGAHNGVVSNQLEINGKVDVDSEVIFLLLDKSKNDFKKTFKRLSGSFAITWIDTKEPNTVYFVTHENPLALVYVSELKTIFWASTELALKTCLTATVGLNRRNIWSPKENTVYKITPNLRISKHKVKFKKSIYAMDYSGHGVNYRDEAIGTPLSKVEEDYLRRNDANFNVSDNDSPKKENKWIEADTIKYYLDNFGCERCAELINPKKGFWWNYIHESVLCKECVKKYGYVEGYELYSHQDYINLDYGITKRGGELSEL